MRSSAVVTQALVLKRTSVGEADRVITFFTRDQGKVAGIAKGIRKMSSSQRAYLEPGNLVATQLQETKGLSIIRQYRLIEDFQSARSELKKLKQLFQVLEFIDVMFAEGQEEPLMFDQLVEVLNELNQPQPKWTTTQHALDQMLMSMGYQSLSESPYHSISEYAESLADRPMHSYNFLSVRPK